MQTKNIKAGKCKKSIQILRAIPESWRGHYLYSVAMGSWHMDCEKNVDEARAVWKLALQQKPAYFEEVKSIEAKLK